MPKPEKTDDIATGVDEVNAGHLRAFIERIERLEEEKKAFADDIKDVYGEAKANGFDVKVMRKVVSTPPARSGKANGGGDDTRPLPGRTWHGMMSSVRCESPSSRGACYQSGRWSRIGKQCERARSREKPKKRALRYNSISMGPVRPRSRRALDSSTTCWTSLRATR